MPSAKKVLEQVLRGTADSNIPFRELRQLLLSLGFEERTRGGHHIFRRAGVRELVNIQKEGSKAKVYQVRQVRRIIQEYNLTIGR